VIEVVNRPDFQSATELIIGINQIVLPFLFEVISRKLKQAKILCDFIFGAIESIKDQILYHKIIGEEGNAWAV
jgi:hypothetical protein